jgi:PIN domain nuclease of toxin-antitoxin system
MKFLFDTQLLIWAANSPERLPKKAEALIADPANELFFSAASLWEIAIKYGLNREDFKVEPRVLYQGLIENTYQEIPVSSLHAVAVNDLPSLHKDPFDRLLIAQAKVEGITLLTCDAGIALYPGPILFAGKPATAK